MKAFTLSLSMLLLLLVGCTPAAQPSSTVMPQDLTVGQSIDGKITLTWKYDQKADIEGFRVGYKPIGTATYTDLETLPAEARSYTLEKELTTGKSYYFAVTTLARGKAASYPATVVYRVLAPGETKGIQILKTYASHAGVAVEYLPVNLTTDEQNELGLAYSDSQDFELNDAQNYVKIAAPKNRRGKKSCMQIIPVTKLPSKASKIYIKAYAQNTNKKYHTSETLEIDLPKTPEAINLQWDEITPESLKGKVQVFKTTSKLNGRPFNAWYAVGNPEKTRIKRNDPQNNTPLARQAEQLSKVLVLVNASYFYQNQTIGLYGHNGLQGKGLHYPMRGSLKADHPEYNTSYPASRGFFGVTKEGKPGIYWGSCTADEVPHLYAHPMPVLLGEAFYSDFFPEIVGEPVDFNPYYGVSGGPVILKDGCVPVDFQSFREGSEYYIGNYELIPYDIFGKSVIPDRTAVGILKDGRIVLFVCDGRIAESKGANLIELAQVMKGIGCVDALNLDGGGSTNMWVAGAIINHKDLVKGTQDTRPIRSVIGFFDK